MTVAFHFDAEFDDNQTWLVTVPALPEVATFGEISPSDGDDVLAEARRRGRAAVEEALAARIARGEDIPRPDGTPHDDASITLPLLTTLKVGLYMRARARQVNRAELGRRLGWNRESVDRLFRLDHLSRVSQLEDAYAALGYRLQVRAVPTDPAEAAEEAKAQARRGYQAA